MTYNVFGGMLNLAQSVNQLYNSLDWVFVTLGPFHGA